MTVKRRKKGICHYCHIEGVPTASDVAIYGPRMGEEWEVCELCYRLPGSTTGRPLDLDTILLAISYLYHRKDQ